MWLGNGLFFGLLARRRCDLGLAALGGVGFGEGAVLAFHRRGARVDNVGSCAAEADGLARAATHGLDDVFPDLTIDDAAKFFGDDFVVVAVADDHAVAIFDARDICDGEFFRLVNGGDAQCAELEEHMDIRTGFEFLEELRAYSGDGVAGFVEEDAETFYLCDFAAAEGFMQKFFARVGVAHDKTSSWKSIAGFGCPLLLFAESPEDEDAG